MGMIRKPDRIETPFLCRDGDIRRRNGKIGREHCSAELHRAPPWETRKFEAIEGMSLSIAMQTPFFVGIGAPGDRTEPNRPAK